MTTQTVIVWGEGPDKVIRSGYSRYNTQIARAIQSLGHTVYFHPWDPIFEHNIDGLPILSAHPVVEDKFSVQSLQGWVDSIEPDVLVLCGDWWSINETSLIETDAKVVTFVWIDGKGFPPRASNIFDNSDAITTASRFGVNVLKKEGFKAYYTPPSISETFRKTDIEYNPNLLGFVGKFQARKGIDRLIVTFKELRRTFPNLKLYLHIRLCEEGKPFVLEQWLKALELKDCVIIPKKLPVSDDDLQKLYSRFVGHILLTKGEGWAFPVAEAQACGTPNVVTNFSSQVELVEGHGYLVKPESYFQNTADVTWANVSIEDAVKKITELLDHPDRFRKECMQIAEEYTLENTAQHWEQLLADVT